ncbi:MAG: signal peptidase I [Patescibacteria group bacterium]|jgi:signal peptidase I
MKNPFKKWEGNKVFETVKVIVISLAIIIPIRTFLMEPFYVKGTSMEPNYYSYDYLLINKLKYHLQTPKRGDIVVAKFASDKPYVIKRIVALPGETIDIKDKQVRITETNGNSFLLEEPYLDPANLKNETLNFKIPDDHFMLLGDNRKVSLDSRQQGPIEKKNIKGLVMVKVLNFSPIVDLVQRIMP